MITKRSVHIKKYSTFVQMKISSNSGNTQYTLGDASDVYEGVPDISYKSVIYVKDSGIIYTHGGVYNCSEQAFYEKRYDLTNSETLALLQTSSITYSETEGKAYAEATSSLKLDFPRDTSYYVTLYTSGTEGENPTLTYDENVVPITEKVVLRISNTFSVLINFNNPTYLSTVTIQETEVTTPTHVSQLVNDKGYLVGNAENETLLLKEG